MFGKTTLIALLGAVSVSANQVMHLMTRAEHAPIFSRQLNPSQLPAQCQTQCQSALTIYQACTTGDQNTCLSVCQASNFAAFNNCLQCIVTAAGSALSAADIATVNGAIGSLAQACQAAGTPVTATSFSRATGSATGASSASGAATTSAAQTTSAIGTSAISSLTSALSSLTSAASSAAATSRAAGVPAAFLPQGAGAVLTGLVGVAAGAVLIL